MRTFTPRFPPSAHLLAVSGLFAFLVLSGCRASPEAAYDDFVEASRAGAWEELYGMLDEESRAALDAQMVALLETGARADSTLSAPPNLDGPNLFARLVDEHPSLHRRFDVAGYTLLDTEHLGDEARLTVQLNRGGPEVEPAIIRLRREEGVWRVRMP